MTDVKVSVIMPSLNVAGYIKKAVKSVCDQTLQDIEIICIDAGSDDGTWEMLCELSAADERIVLIQSEERSYGYQVNLGIDMAKGKYIGIVETDDYVSPEMFQSLYSIAESGDYDYVKCDYTAFWTQSDGEAFHIHRKALLTENLYGKSVFPIEHIGLATDDWYLWNGIYKRDFLKHCGIRLSESKGAAFQDIGFLHKTVTRAKKAVYAHGELYHYCLDREGASSNRGNDLFFAFREYNNIYARLGDSDEEKRFFLMRMSESFVLACRNVADLSAMQKQYSWFIKIIKEGIDSGLLDTKQLPASIRENFDALMISLDHYNEMRQNRRSDFKKFVGEPGKYEIVIFGCGNHGSGIYRTLRDSGYSIISFLDNNTDLWGKTIDGVIIENPAKASENNSDVRYIVANEKFADEIESQLMSLVNNPHVYKLTSAVI